MRVKKSAGILLLSVLFALAFSSAACLLTVRPAAAAGASEAYFLYSDGTTRGNWYVGEKSTKDMRDNRIYGKAGAMITYHKITGDGQPVKDVAMINDFTEESAVNYVEYPDWVESITGDIQSTNDTPHGYWNYHEGNTNGTGQNANMDSYPGSLKSVDPSVWNCKSVYQISRDDMNYTFNVTDDEWHRVSVYAGEVAHNKSQPTYRAYIRILDLDGNVLAETVAENYCLGTWYTFAVKGSFVVNAEKFSSAPSVGVSGVFLDDDYEDPAIAKTDLQAVRTGARQVNLSWVNGSDAFTAIYRREAGETVFERIALTEPGVHTYTDLDTKVSTTYEYIIGAGVARTVEGVQTDVKDFNVPDTSMVAEATTAAYKPTRMVLDKTDYSVIKGRPLNMKATVYRDDGEGNIDVPYEGVDVTFTLDGETVYDTKTAGDPQPNMQTVLGVAKTNADGVAALSYRQPYAGEYTVTASMDIQPDKDDAENGYDGSSATARFVLKEEEAASVRAPVLTMISEAIKPGDTMTIFGNWLTPDSHMLVAYAPNAGCAPAEFNEAEPPAGVKYLTVDDLAVTDEIYQTGIMLTFPADEAPGMYDFWVKNENGWSNGLTLNGTRPLYINQEASYAGLPIEIVGRNFFPTEYGMDVDPFETLRVKLVRTGDIHGNADGIAEEKIVPVKDGVRYTEEESFTGEAIDETNPYRITFTTPDVAHPGTFEVYVASDGRDYRLLDRPQTLIIYEKKAADWNTDVFGPVKDESGNDLHIGNDPLDLGVYWAQDLNYTNIEIAVPNPAPSANFLDNDGKNEEMDAVWAASRQISSQISRLSAGGGGVLYFPEGDYYLMGHSSTPIRMQDNVILVGAGRDKTNIYYTGAGGSTFIRGDSVDNVGVARLSIRLFEHSGGSPDAHLCFGDTRGGSTQQDASLYTAQNLFVSDVRFDFPFEGEKTETGRAMGMYNGQKNFVYQNIISRGGNTPLYNGFYRYVTIRNADIEMIGLDCNLSAGATYSFVENTRVISGQEGHGWSAHNDCYIANNYIYGTGTTTHPKNNGEVIMFEPPGGYFSRGVILEADARSFTCAITSGVNIRENTQLLYSYFAIYITEGTGMGQLRYFHKTPVADENGVVYGNRYRLLDGERDWEIIPDSTSAYTIMCPMEGQTVYRNKAEHCVKSIYLYSQCFDAIVAENTLVETEGIGLTSAVNDQGRLNPDHNIRIENNTIIGVSPGTGSGGIFVNTGRGSEYCGMLIAGVSIRGNVLKDVVKDPDAEYKSSSELPEVTGIYIKSGATTGSQIKGDVRFIIVEGNTVEKAQYGIYCDSRITGIVIRNNTVGDIEVEDDVTYFGAEQMRISATHELYVDGQRSALSGEYALNTQLPVPQSADGKSFWGWSLSEDYVPGTQPITRGVGSNVMLYAIFGYTVSLRYNYASDGKDQGDFYAFTAMAGDTVGKIIDDYGNPYRKGYDFGGWYVDPGCTQPFDATQPVTEKMTLYAKWTLKSTDSVPGGDTPETPPEQGCGCGGMAVNGSCAAVAALLCLAGAFLFVRRTSRPRRQ